MAELVARREPSSLDQLIDASRASRIRAEKVIARSLALCPRSEQLRTQSVARRLASRSRTTYAIVDGLVENGPVTAVVRQDGTVDGDRCLLDRARLIVALGDTFEGGRLTASLGSDPLASVLTVTRACDETRMVQMGPRSPFAP